MTVELDKWVAVERDFRSGVRFTELLQQYELAPIELLHAIKQGGWRVTVEEKAPAVAGTLPEVLPPVPSPPARERTAEIVQLPVKPSAPTCWDDARECFEAGLSPNEIADGLSINVRELVERLTAENWKPSLEAMLRERFQRDGAELLTLLERKSDEQSGHRCDECGEPVERPVYCGRTCQQRAYRDRRRGREEGGSDVVGE